MPTTKSNDPFQVASMNSSLWIQNTLLKNLSIKKWNLKQKQTVITFKATRIKAGGVYEPTLAVFNHL